MLATNDSAVSIAPIYRTIPILQEDKSYSLGKREFPTVPGMDAVRTLIVVRAKEKGISLKELSEKAGKSHAYFQQFIKREVPKYLPEDVRAVVAPLLGVDEAELKSAASKLGAGTKNSQNARIGGTVALSRTIPAYGHARGGRDGQFILNGNRVADLLAPPSLASVPDAYAVYIVGTSMEPRYFAGEAVFVNPRLPVRKGDFVVAQIASDEGEPAHAFVKRFVSMDAKLLRLEQFNPKKPLTFPANRVVSVHRIVMGGDG